MIQIARLVVFLPGGKSLDVTKSRIKCSDPVVVKNFAEGKDGKLHENAVAFYGIDGIKSSNVELVESKCTQEIAISDELWNSWMETAPSYKSLATLSEKNIGRQALMKKYTKSTEIMRAMLHAKDIVADITGIIYPKPFEDFKFEFIG